MYNTPFYYYDLNLFYKTIAQLKESYTKYNNFVIHYAVKANANNRLLQIILESGLGVDCTSGNEIKRVLEIGFDSSQILFTGPGKSDREIDFALQHNIFSFNCESLQELEVVNHFATIQNKIADVMIRINPNIDAHTHHYITTGLEENKFGINMSEMGTIIAKLKDFKNIHLIGLHFHVGSQTTDMSVFKNLSHRINEIQDWLALHNIEVNYIDVGGGLGVDYNDPDKHPIPDFENYFKTFHDVLVLRSNQKVHFELGRAIVAQCGSLVSRVLYVKKGTRTTFVIVDAGMTELIRPALYNAYHKIENISTDNDKSSMMQYTVVGPICESSDCFGQGIDLSETQRGDLIRIHSVGAYGEVMASNYNLREKAPSVYAHAPCIAKNFILKT